MEKDVTTLQYSLLPVNIDTPLDARSVVHSESEIQDIPYPYVGLLVFVKQLEKYAVVTALNDGGEVADYSLLNNGIEFITVTQNGDTYSSDKSAADVYQLLSKGVLPVVICGYTIYTPYNIQGANSSFISFNGFKQATLHVYNNSWSYEEVEHKTMYINITKNGNAYTADKSFDDIERMYDEGAAYICAKLGSRIFIPVQIEERTKTMVFSTIDGINDDNIAFITLIDSDVEYHEIPLNNVASKNLLGLIQTEEDSKTNTSYMLPVAITPRGYTYNGLNIVEVQEPGLYVVDKNMDAGFSSELGTVVVNSGQSTPTNPQTNTQLEEDVESLKTQVSTINTALGNLGNVKILIDNNA